MFWLKLKKEKIDEIELEIDDQDEVLDEKEDLEVSSEEDQIDQEIEVFE